MKNKYFLKLPKVVQIIFVLFFLSSLVLVASFKIRSYNALQSLPVISEKDFPFVYEDSQTLSNQKLLAFNIQGSNRRYSVLSTWRCRGSEKQIISNTENDSGLYLGYYVSKFADKENDSIILDSLSIEESFPFFCSSIE